MDELLDLINAATAANRTLKALPLHFENRTLELQIGITERQPTGNRGKSTLALAALIGTGCRPVELAKGLQMKLDIDNTLIVAIPNVSNTDSIRGHRKYRLIRIGDRKRNLATELLFEAASAKQGTIHIKISASRIAKLVKSLSEKLREEMGIRGKNIEITPRVFRQLFIRQLLYPAYFSVDEVLGICGLSDPRSLTNYICRIPHIEPTSKWANFTKHLEVVGQGGTQ